MFTLDQKISTHRQGSLLTPHGTLSTPFFMPDATRASVRGLSSSQLQQLGLEALVVNTYHLMLEPGSERISAAGGIHQFMDWPHPVLSDSGGYQVFSLIHKHPELGRITETGAEFRSVLDGSKHLLTPERSIEIQFELGVDMMVCLDDPRPNDVSESEMTESVERTIRWAKRSREEYDRQILARGLTETTRPLLFGVVQGGLIPALRQYCAAELTKLNFDGYGFGGRHVDSAGNFLEEILRVTAAAIPEDKIRFALGIGAPYDIVRCYSFGWDMFDCVIPTREGRHGRLFIMDEKKNQGSNSEYQNADFYHTINIRNAEFKDDDGKIDPTCDCTLCTRYTPSYLHHLFRVGEPLALVLASEHNLKFYTRLIEKLRTF